MAEAIDIRWVLMVSGLHLFSIIELVAEAPLLDDVHRLATCLNRPLLAKEVERLLKVLGIDVGGSFYEAVGAVGELDEGEAEVLGLDIGVVELVGVGVDLINVITHHPPQEINVVDALVHQGPTILLPGAAPRGTVIVVTPPVPTDMGSSVEETTETVLLHRLPNLHHRLVEAVLVAGADSHPMLFRFIDDSIGIFDGEGDGLLDNDVDTGPDAVEGYGGMLAALGADGDEVGFLLLDHRLVVGVSFGSCSIELELEELILKHLLVDITETNNLEVVGLGCCQMVGGDPSTSDKGISHIHVKAPHLLKSRPSFRMPFHPQRAGRSYRRQARY